MNQVDLPVMDVLPQLLEALATHKTAILVAPPGAGKTTAVPLALLNAQWLGDQKIILLEPRRLAARSAAQRMAQNLGENVGQTIGYRMRLDTKVSAHTKIEIVTEGVFQRMISGDPELAGVGCVIFDEFHERSLDADFGLALTLDARSALRDDLRLLLMSATLDGDRISRFIGNAPVVQSLGRMHPVEIKYQPRLANERIENAVASAIRKALREEQGSILAFLPGVPEIRRTQERLDGKLPANAYVAPLFGAMDIQDQAQAIQAPGSGERKIVLATTLAESSITIDGVRIVIDSGLARLPVFEAGLGISRLETKRAAKASIAQRAGRAGRTAPGVAIRLWQEEQTAALAEFDVPEILQADLSSMVLDCADWGVGNPRDLPFLDKPPNPHIDEARKLLIDISALDENNQITDKGKSISKFGMSPRLAAMIVAGLSFEDRYRRAFLALLISERGLGGNENDLGVRFERAWREKSHRAKTVRAMAKRMAGALEDVRTDDAASSIGLMLCDAYPDRIARRRDNQPGQYVMANGRGVVVDETSPIASNQFLVAADIAGGATNARIVSAASLEEAELLERFNSGVSEIESYTFDRPSRRLKARRKRKLGAITLSASNMSIKAGNRALMALLEAVRNHGLEVLNWGKASSALRHRLQWLHAVDPREWPDLSNDALIDGLETWLAPFLGDKTGFDELGEKMLCDALMNCVPYDLHNQIDQLAPTHFAMPSGSNIPLVYQQGAEPPKLSVRVQELFGLKVHPAIYGGKMKLTIEMLSPAHRPIQITQDLPGFWQGSWADMRSDMRGRYPRHEWPEDPAEAVPTRRAKPRK